MSRIYNARDLPHLQGVDLDSLPTARGRLRYDPAPVAKNSNLPPSRGMLILDVGPGWLDYLRHQARHSMPRRWKWMDERSHTYDHEGEHRPWVPYLRAQGGLDLPALGAHITVIYPHEYVTKNRRLWGKDEGYDLEFKFHPQPIYTGTTKVSGKAAARRGRGKNRPGSEGPESKQGHVWYPIWSEELEQQREAYGLRGYTKYQMHLTVGVWQAGTPVYGSYVRTL
jgi:hypothetical protein